LSDVLVVDDEQAVCWALQQALTRKGHRVVVAASAEEGLTQAELLTPEVIVLDVRLPGTDGLSELARLRQIAPHARVIVITAYGNLETAVRAVQGGAFDYLAKPFDLDQALDAVDRALRIRAPSRPATEANGEQNLANDEIVGRSPAMQAVFKRIALVAQRESSVLITGESGTGKELVARAIHRHSPRGNGPFLPVHIASLNPNLVESELFGHVKGSFTGATQARRGMLALADGGTVFLDELGDIPLSVQVKLLRVLERNEVYPVGGGQPVRLDVRILAATHLELERRVAEGSFRHDLYFRLNVFQIHLAPLHDRPEAVIPLAEHFLGRLDPRSLPLPADTVQFLTTQPWLGNARELRNALEHAVIVARGGPILPEQFPVLAGGLSTLTSAEQLGAAVRNWFQERVRLEGTASPTRLHEKLLAGVEPALLAEVLSRVRGNRWVAAQWLGLNRATVRKKLASYGLRDAFRSPESGTAKDE
jgi:two-component system, NtrC family, nitrogen regulation response regulator GlnG